MDSHLSKSGLIYSPKVVVHNIIEIKLKIKTAIKMGRVKVICHHFGIFFILSEHLMELFNFNYFFIIIRKVFALGNIPSGRFPKENISFDI